MTGPLTYRIFSYLSSHDLIFPSFPLTAVVIILHQMFCSSFTKAACPLESTNHILHSQGCKTHSEHRMRGPAGLDIENMCLCVCGDCPKKDYMLKTFARCAFEGSLFDCFSVFWLSPENYCIFSSWEEDTCSGMRRRKGGSINGC